MKKILALALAAALSLSLFGCAKNPASSTAPTPSQTGDASDTVKKDPITLTWFNVGNDQQKDYKLALDNINKTVQSHKGLEHVSLEFITCGWGDCTQKLTTLIGSGAALDLFNPCAAGYLDPWVEKGACADLTDLVKEYAPDVLTELPDWLLKTQTIGGKLYAIPTYQQNNANYDCYFMPTELAEKYMDLDTLRKLADTPTAKDKAVGLAVYKQRMDLITDYLQKCKDAGEIRKGAVESNSLGLTSYTETGANTMGLGVRNIYDYNPLNGPGNTEVIFGTKMCMEMTKEDLKKAAETGEELEWQEVGNRYLYDWWEKGLIREDVLSTNESDLRGQQNGLVIWMEQAVGANDPEILKSLEKSKSDSYGMDITIVPRSNTYLMRSDNASGGHCVYVNSKNKEEAVTVAGLTATKAGADVLNAIVWGVEGTHYTKNDDGTITTPYQGGSAGSDDAYGQYNWAWGNTFDGYVNQATNLKFFDFVQEMHKTALPDHIAGFKFDKSAYATEEQMLSALKDESIIFDKTNGYGSASYRAAKKSYYQGVIDVGIEKIWDDFQKQLDDFLAANK